MIWQKCPVLPQNSVCCPLWDMQDEQLLESRDTKGIQLERFLIALLLFVESVTDFFAGTGSALPYRLHMLPFPSPFTPFSMPRTTSFSFHFSFPSFSCKRLWTPSSSKEAKIKWNKERLRGLVSDMWNVHTVYSFPFSSVYLNSHASVGTMLKVILE